MKWFLDLTTRAKLFLSFGLMIVFLAAVIVTAYRGIASIQESQQRLYHEDFTNAVDLLEIISNENGARAALLTMLSLAKQQDRELWHQDVKNRTKEREQRMQRLIDRRRHDDPKSIRQFEELTAVQAVFTQTRDAQVIPLIYSGKSEEAKKLTLGIQNERYVKMRDIATDLGADALRQAQQRIAQSGKTAEHATRVFGAIGIIGLLLSVALAMCLDRIIASPLKNLSGVADRVASGDLTVNVSSHSRADEVGGVAQAFQRMVANLREVNRELREGVNVLGASASEILAATAQVAAGAVETATAVSETTTTVEEVKQTSQVSSQKAKHVSESAQKVSVVSQAGRKAVDDTIEGMGRIREQMESVAGSIMRLSEQSQAIGNIIATVNDLAEQSNLLAVNAAIEAAKAGEQGRGFAVVAQEVKNLAEQSKHATAEVRTILSDIQKATSAAVMATEQGGKAVAAGVKQSTEAGESIRMLAESIGEAAQAAAQIAASTQQQLVGMDQVALAIENIKQASTQNVASTRQTEAAAQNLHELGQRVKELVTQYKV